MPLGRCDRALPRPCPPRTARRSGRRQPRRGRDALPRRAARAGARRRRGACAGRPGRRRGGARPRRAAHAAPRARGARAVCRARREQAARCGRVGAATRRRCARAGARADRRPGGARHRITNADGDRAVDPRRDRVRAARRPPRRHRSPPGSDRGLPRGGPAAARPRSDLRDDRGRGPGHPVGRVRGRDGVLLLRGLRGDVRGPARPRRMSETDELARIAPDIETLAQRLAAVDYLVDEGLATSLFLCLRLPQPLLLEGEAGVGKTEAAKALALVLDTPLVRLQCYDGIDAAEALYEWNYPRQLLSIRLADSRGVPLAEEELFGPEYLIRRPLLRALEHPGPRPAVLLIDEIDRADDDFEAFLLELLADASVTIPELGTMRATHPPVIVLTSNRTRDLHDAVKRRCLYHWIAYPSPEREVEIVRRRVKGASETLAVQVADAVSRMRDSDVQKPPGIAEAIDWLAALSLLGVERLDAGTIDRTLGSVLKYEEDQEVIRAAGLERLVRGRG